MIISKQNVDDLLVRMIESPHEEVCGVILRGRIIPMMNVHPKPERAFAFDGKEQLAVWAEWGGIDGDLIVYHSHPNGRARPSRTDVAVAKDSRIRYLILSVRYVELYLYKVIAGVVVEEALDIR